MIIDRVVKACKHAKQLPEELHKPIIRKFEKRNKYSPFKGNVWGADLAGMQLIGKFYKGFRFGLCAVVIQTKCAQVLPFKNNKKGIKCFNTFKKKDR